MVAKVYADCLSDDDTESPVESTLEPGSGGVESEAAAVAAWFEALPAELRSYFDREASSGRGAYGHA